MAINLDLGTQIKKDLTSANAAASDKKKTGSKKIKSHPAKDVSTSKKKRMGRPKGKPTVARSIRIDEDLYAKLVQKHEETRLSYNDLMNDALREFLK